jgi:hypothetical protein
MKSLGRGEAVGFTDHVVQTSHIQLTVVHTVLPPLQPSTLSMKVWIRMVCGCCAAIVSTSTSLNSWFVDPCMHTLRDLFGIMFLQHHGQSGIVVIASYQPAIWFGSHQGPGLPVCARYESAELSSFPRFVWVHLLSTAPKLLCAPLSARV